MDSLGFSKGMVGEGRPVKEVTSVDARVQALVERILSQTVKQALLQPVDQAIKETQSSKRRKIKSMTPSTSKHGRFKANQLLISSNLKKGSTRLAKDGGFKPTKGSVQKSRRCHNCNSSGHLSSACKVAIMMQSCFTCRKSGHRAAFCPSAGRSKGKDVCNESVVASAAAPRGPGPQQHPALDQSEASKRKDVCNESIMMQSCFTCRKSGHRAAFCPSAGSSKGKDVCNESVVASAAAPRGPGPQPHPALAQFEAPKRKPQLVWCQWTGHLVWL